MSLAHPIAVISLAVGLAAAPAAAQVIEHGQEDHAFTVGAIEVVHPWARATRPGSTTTLAFMDIDNGGDPDTLVSARSDIAEAVEIVGITIVSGPNATVPIGPIELPAGEEFVLDPHGAALELRGLSAPLARGDQFEMTLVFEHAGELVIDVEVEAANAVRHSHAH